MNSAPLWLRGIRALVATLATLALEEGQMGTEATEAHRNKATSSPNRQDAVKTGNTQAGSSVFPHFAGEETEVQPLNGEPGAAAQGVGPGNQCSPIPLFITPSPTPAQSEQSLERVLDRTREERAPCAAPKDRPGVPERKVHSCTVQEAAGLGGKAEMGA